MFAVAIMKSIIICISCFSTYVFAWKVTVCTDADFKGACATLQAHGCMNTNLFDDDTLMNDRIRSLNTHGGCVRAFADNHCVGKSRAYYHSSPERDLAETKFNNIISSFGPCYPDECANKGGKLIDNCIFHDVVFFGGRKSGQGQTEVKESENPIIKYQRGHKDRVEYVRAIIKRRHLDTGTDPSEEVNAYIRSMGLSNDQVGYIIPKILGGTGTKTYNVFPQNEKVKRGELYSTVDQMVYDTVKEQSYLEMEVTLQYESDDSTRPFVLLYRFHGDKFFRMRNLINPK